jgi:hypothetical protein
MKRYIQPIPADTTGHRIKLVAAGLRQVGARCDTIAGGLSASAAAPAVAALTWQTNATAVSTARAGACADLAGAAARSHLGYRILHHQAFKSPRQSRHRFSARIRRDPRQCPRPPARPWRSPHRLRYHRVAKGGVLAGAGAVGVWILSQLPKLVHPFSP